MRHRVAPINWGDPFYFMFEIQKELNIFEKGILFFNTNQYESAHKEWEKLWKIIGNKPRRTGMKVFLQLTGIHQNIELGKWDAVRYGIRIAALRLRENKEAINQWIEVDSITCFLQQYEKNNISLKVFDELKIERKWGRVHKDLGTK
jgi:hypothetical protein|tara:strand:+ start:5 stop:445 length:441 start_codon:yes stop_codon:yes gene_type:complete